MTTPYPVHVDAQLDPAVSRWQWMFKWLLAIPHYFVLAFLWVAFVALSMVAFVAILFTGRYPRAIFDFNVGVLRWTWRVAYYAYGALGTDRYPPFSLSEHPDYPARLTIDYPQHLSRGLVLVKWWLLAIPHYLIISLFLGGGAYVADQATNGDQALAWSLGLIGVMVLIAGFALLFTGRYPQSVFDLVLGMNRWVLRVAGYAALMTDQYPPFRLDQGGEDPGVGHVALSPMDPRLQVAQATQPTQAGPAAPGAPVVPPPTGESRWGAGRVFAVVIASLMVMGSLVLAVPATGISVAAVTARDSQGYLMSPYATFRSGTNAITTGNLQIASDVTATDVPHALLGDGKVSIRPQGSQPVFVGIAKSSEVSKYLQGVRHATIVDFGRNGLARPVYRISGGTAPGTPPADATFWQASSVATGTHAVTFPITKGNWTVVLMNADGSAGINADVAAGATVPALGWVIAGLWMGVGAGLVLGAVVLVVAISTATKKA